MLSDALGRPVVVTGVTRVGEEFGFAGESYRVDVDGTTGPGAVVAKLWAPRNADDVGELRFYRDLAGETPIRLPRFHHGGVDTTAGTAWIVLEALDGFRQGDEFVEESLDSVRRVVRTIARAQARWMDRLDAVQWLPSAPRFRRDPDYLTSRRADYLDRFGPLPDSTAARLFDEIPRLVEIADLHLAGAAETLLHGDLTPDNILFLDEEPVIVDWAHCGRGPGVHDLASILFVFAPVDHLREVVLSYTAGLHEVGMTDVDGGVLRRQLTGAMIHEFITRTLGVARWAATTPRGLQLLERSVARTPLVVAAWRDLDPDVFDSLTS